MIWKSGILSRKHRNTEAKEYRSEGIQRLRHIEMQTHRSIEIQKRRHTEARAYRSEGIQRLRHIKVQTHRSIEIQKHRNTEAWIYGSVEILEAGRKVCG